MKCNNFSNVMLGRAPLMPALGLLLSRTRIWTKSELTIAQTISLLYVKWFLLALA